VVGEAGTMQLVFQAVRAHRPAVLVLDLNPPGGSSIEAIGTVARFSPETAIVVLTMEDDKRLMHAAYETGAHGCSQGVGGDSARSGHLASGASGPASRFDLHCWVALSPCADRNAQGSNRRSGQSRPLGSSNG
jgi:hypothetical protein